MQFSFEGLECETSTIIILGGKERRGFSVISGRGKGPPSGGILENGRGSGDQTGGGGGAYSAR